MKESKYNIKSFTPEYELRKKYTLNSFIGFTLLWLVSNLSVFLISYFDNTVSYPDPVYGMLKYSTPIVVILFLISYWMIKLYYYSIIFEIVDDEIHVNRGIITKSKKIVPYRTITNFLQRPIYMDYHVDQTRLKSSIEWYWYPHRGH